jgi:hypothetical protein
MIDVFMLAKEDILDHDESFGNLADVVFCEYNQEYFPEITEMIGIEGSGFLGELERFYSSKMTGTPRNSLRSGVFSWNLKIRT